MGYIESKSSMNLHVCVICPGIKQAQSLFELPNQVPTKAYELDGMNEYAIVTTEMSERKFEETINKLDGVISILRVY